jgi:apolipoprotein N-acyltransferase
MAFAIDYRRCCGALLAVMLTTLLVWFGTGVNFSWPLLWFAPLPVLLFALRSSWWGAALAAVLSWFVGNLNMWHYYDVVLHAPPIIRIQIFVLPAIVFMAAVLLFRVLLQRCAWWSALLAFPAMWVSFEYVLNLVSIHGAAESLSYSQLNFLPVLQLASITGLWGISFLVMLFPAALAIGLHIRHSAPKRAFAIAGVGLGVLGLVVVFGAIRLSMPVPGQRVKVGLIASDQPANVDMAAEGADTAHLFHDYAAKAEALAAQGAKVIVLPEKLGVVCAPDTESTNALFQSLADKTKADIVVGLILISWPVAYNQARVYSPDAPVLTYNKHHLLPPFESNLTSGAAVTLMSKPAATWGVAVCKDMDFTPLSRQYGTKSVGLMLVPGWDFDLDRWWHGHMAVMRGVEDGFSIARAAKQGYLTVSDNRGRILAETQSNTAPFATLVADVPTGHDTTLYVVLGDWFAWLTLATFCFTLVQFYRLRKNPRT